MLFYANWYTVNDVSEKCVPPFPGQQSKQREYLTLNREELSIYEVLGTIYWAANDLNLYRLRV